MQGMNGYYSSQIHSADTVENLDRSLQYYVDNGMLIQRDVPSIKQADQICKAHNDSYVQTDMDIAMEQALVARQTLLPAMNRLIMASSL